MKSHNASLLIFSPNSGSFPFRADTPRQQLAARPPPPPITPPPTPPDKGSREPAAPSPPEASQPPHSTGEANKGTRQGGKPGPAGTLTGGGGEGAPGPPRGPHRSVPPVVKRGGRRARLPSPHGRGSAPPLAPHPGRAACVPAAEPPSPSPGSHDDARGSGTIAHRHLRPSPASKWRRRGPAPLFLFWRLADGPARSAPC